MKLTLICLVIFFTSTLFAQSKMNPKVIMETNMGQMEIELFQDKSPISVANFLKYVDEGFYQGTIFHRVIGDFMIQGGGFNEKMEEKKTREPIKNEAPNGLTNETGTLAMARTSDPHSATAQFFINTQNNPALDHQSPGPQSYGYAVFGRVINGMSVVNRIKMVKTDNKNGHENVPVDAVVIKSIKRK